MCLLAVSGLQLWLFMLPLTMVVIMAIGLGVVLYPTTSCSVELPCSPLRLAVSLPVSILVTGMSAPRQLAVSLPFCSLRWINVPSLQM